MLLTVTFELLGSWQDATDDSSAWLHVSDEGRHWPPHCHCAKVHAVELDGRVQEVVSEPHHHLPHWKPGGESKTLQF